MLILCDHCGELQPGGPWRCRCCRALMPYSRPLLRFLLALVALLVVALLW